MTRTKRALVYGIIITTCALSCAYAAAGMYSFFHKDKKISDCLKNEAIKASIRATNSLDSRLN